MKLLFAAALACATLAGCDPAPTWGWMRTDGQSMKNDPVLHQQFETDKLACIGEMQKAGLSGATSVAGASDTMQSIRRHEAMDVIRECMATRGYVIVPLSEAQRAPAVH
jgi:hypothetical protein